MVLLAVTRGRTCMPQPRFVRWPLITIYHRILVKGGGWERYSVKHLKFCGEGMRTLNKKFNTVTEMLVTFNRVVFVRQHILITCVFEALIALWLFYCSRSWLIQTPVSICDLIGVRCSASAPNGLLTYH